LEPVIPPFGPDVATTLQTSSGSTVLASLKMISGLFVELPLVATGPSSTVGIPVKPSNSSKRTTPPVVAVPFDHVNVMLVRLV
jgi:hypothetical protein